MSKTIHGKPLAIDEAEYQAVMKIFAEMRELDKKDRATPDSDQDRFFSTRSDFQVLLKAISTKGVQPVAAVIHKILTNAPVTEVTIKFIDWLHRQVPMNSAYALSGLDERTLNAALRAFSFSLSDGIDVAHWTRVAEQGREMVLAAAQSRDVNDAKYMSAKEDFDKVYGPELERFAKDPVLGGRIRSARSSW